MLTITLDWLAFTYKEDTHEAANWISIYAGPQGSIPIAPTNGYRSAYRTPQGVVVQWNVDREEMGRHVVISGSALRDVLEYYGLDQQTLVQTVLHSGASITRLDLAKDLIGTEISLDSIYKRMERKQTTGTARSFSQIHSINGGNTVYVGSRQSEKFIRIYDKAAQSALQDVQWYRFELETKGMVARALADILGGFEQWASAFNTIAKAMVDISEDKQWKRFFEDQTIEIGIPKLEKKSDREKWIETQVTPAVVKHFLENKDSKAIETLMTLLQFIKNSGNIEGVI